MTTATAAVPLDDGLIHIDRRAQFATLGAVMLGMLLSALDQTIVGTAIPRSWVSSTAWSTTAG